MSARSCSNETRLLSAVAAVRHAERADAVWGHPWNTSADAARFSYDPPITGEGMRMAEQRAKELTSSGASFDVVISSPYLRAVQTALVFAEHFDAVVILDHQLGEVLGPDVFGAEGPAATPWRTWETLMSALESCSEVPVNTSRLQCDQLLGEPPLWPETMKAARTRYAARYLTYLRRVRRARMTCLLVTHGHMMQASLRVLPATSCLEVESVGYCATVMAQMYMRCNRQVSDSSSISYDSPVSSEAAHEVGERLAGFLNGREWGRAEPLNDSTLQETALCWWEASVNGITYHGSEGDKHISSPTKQHPCFLASLQQHLHWNWHHLEGLLGVLRPLHEAVRLPDMPTSPKLTESAWCRIVSTNSDGGEFNRFASEDSFCKLISCQESLLSSKSGLDSSPVFGRTHSVFSIDASPKGLSPKSLTSPKSRASAPMSERMTPFIKPMAKLQRRAGRVLDLKLAESSLAQRRACLSVV
eukprot:TRINITY_DN11328_c1_g1_i1.p1 TRINITY_DN11328_c1_g1~~TRINITY_DN11328_c1_g1_i1.p1  ORF type:complete len:474 (+),score=54.27 TRINITY_DN11328_c1_g1_i1:64-1485(+)